MPRLYLTPAELAEQPIGLGLAPYLQQLAPGVLDKLLFRASQRCDTFCQKRLQAPGNTTLSLGATNASTSISVASTLTFDDGAEQAVLIGNGANLETCLIQPGGVALSQTAGTLLAPYPGTFALATPLVFSHNSGEPVVGLYQEVSEAGGASHSDTYTEAMQTQAAQLALAHLPPAQMELTRVVFIRNYPIIAVSMVEHSYSFDTTFNTVDISSGLSIETMQGWMRFKIGAVILREGLMRITYTGGYQTLPDDIKLACSYFLAEQMVQLVNPFALKSQTLGKRSQTFELDRYAIQAKELLKPYRRTV